MRTRNFNLDLFAFVLTLALRMLVVTVYLILNSQSCLVNLSTFFFILFHFFCQLGAYYNHVNFKKFILSAFSNFSPDDYYSPGFNLSACMLTNSFVVEFVGILSFDVQREERKIVVSCFSTRRGSLREFFFHFVAMQWR